MGQAMSILIRLSKIILLLTTLAVVIVTIIACVSDVQPTTRHFWIGASIACLGVVSTWKAGDK